MRTVTTIRADKVETGMHLLTDVGNELWISAAIATVEKPGSFVIFSTTAGGRIEVDHLENVTVAYGDIPLNGETVHKN